MINPILEQSIITFLTRAEAISQMGQRISAAELKELQSKLTVSLPEWYFELFSSFPLAGLSLDVPVYESDNDDDGYMTVKIGTARGIYEETEQCYPGIAIREVGYVCLALDMTGGGDPYFMKVTEDDNPPVYQVYHDVGDTATAIEQHGMLKVVALLADFFDKARV